VPINTACSAAEVDYFLTDSQPRVLVVDPNDVAFLEPLVACAGVDRVLTLGADGHNSQAQPQVVTKEPLERRSEHAGSLMQLARQASPLPKLSRELGAASLAAIVYTSGTTGRSKGAMLTRGNLASNAAVLARSWRFTGDDVLLHVLPLFHVHGLFAAIN